MKLWLILTLFATAIIGAAPNPDPFPTARSKKGLQVQMVEDAIALGVQHAALNWNLAQMIDAQLNFKMGYIEAMDRQIKQLSDTGATVSLILLYYKSGDAELDRLMLHPKYSPESPNNLTQFNTSTEESTKALRACFEFIAERYSKPGYPHGRVANYIVGNEVNSHWFWANMGRTTMEEFADDYIRSIRVCHSAVRRFSTTARVYVSLEHHWNIRYPGGDAGQAFPARPFLDYLAAKAGDIDWHVAFHPYPEDLFQPRTWNDKSATEFEDTPRITFKNIEVLTRFLEKPAMLHDGKARRVILSEQGFHSTNDPEGEKAQAAAYAFAYYRVSKLDGIDSFILHRHVDHKHEGGLNLGLWSRKSDSVATPDRQKPIYDVFKRADQPDWREAFAFALPVVGIRDWSEIDPPAFNARGYYMTFMRQPLWGLPEWKAAIDCMVEDKANMLILWMGGGFKSKKFPITWEYNRDHKNVQQDFARELIEYAHSKNIRVLLGFTPFGYDGANQFTIQHPELKAKKPDGSAVDPFGIHCWGWSLCPARAESQTFMLDYVREMLFEFYPNADGALIESSDYDVCRCPDCGTNYYKNEFAFVRKISDEIWAAKPNGTVIIYPHYFTKHKLSLDPRWTLYFTPHSAHFDRDLIARAKASYYWTDAPSLGTPSGIRQATITAAQHGISGFMPSLEPFSYPRPPQEANHGKVGEVVQPLGLDWLPDDAMVLTNPLVRLQRLAFREFSANPNLSETEFRERAESIGIEPLDELFDLQRMVNLGRQWQHSSPLVNPSHNDSGKYTNHLPRLREIKHPALTPITTYILQQWDKN